MPDAVKGVDFDQFSEKLIKMLDSIMVDDDCLSNEEIAEAIIASGFIEELRNEAYDVGVDSALHDHFGLSWKDAAGLRKEIQRLQDAARWIPVSERLPVLQIDDYEEPDGSRVQFEVSEDQWVFTASGHQTKARYETGAVFQGWVGDYGETIRDVTHWMPLPEPPKGE